MADFLKKALARGLTPGNVVSWCALEASSGTTPP